MSSKTCLIANPAAGRGRGARLLPRTARAFAGAGITDVRLTEAPGDEARQVRLALDAGCDTLAVLGGDGTWGKAAAELARLGAPARLAFLAAGTGNDFVKNLATPAHDPDAMARLVAGGSSERRVDMAAVDDELFLNVAGFGFDVAVLLRAERTRWSGGAVSYLIAALRELPAYRGLPVAIDDGPSEPCLILAFANGAYVGGVFHIAPTARVNDGLLDAIAVADVGRAGRPGLLVRAARGTHLRHPRVTLRRNRSFRLRFREPPAYEADGELRHAAAREVRVDVRPGILRVVAAPDAPA